MPAPVSSLIPTANALRQARAGDRGEVPVQVWDVLALDERGFVVTGRDVPVESWVDGRPPTDLETSVPGVFAVGDVRAGSMKRVASATGEGASVVSLVHAFLAEGHSPPLPQGQFKVDAVVTGVTFS